MSRWTSLLLALPFTGCFLQSVELPTPEALPSVAQVARERWVTATCLVPKFPELRYVQDLKCDRLTAAYGCFNHITNVIEISNRVPAKDFELVLLHEFGHAFSIDQGHVSAWQGVMAAGIYQAQTHITSHDLDLVCDRQECPCRRPERPSTPP